MSEAPLSEELIDQRVTELLQNTTLEDKKQLVRLVFDAWEPFTRRCEQDWIPRIAQVFTANPPGLYFPLQLLNTYVLAAKRYPPLQLFMTLSLEGNRLTPHTIEAVLRHPDMCNLDALSLVECSLYNVGLVAISQALLPNKLRVLDVQDNRIGDEAVMALANSGKLTNLTHLCLFRNHLEKPGMSAIMNSPGLPKLQMLSVGFQNRIPSRDLCEAIAEAPNLGRLQDLILEYSDITDDDADILANAQGLKGLARMHLRGNRLTKDGRAKLEHSPYLANTVLVS